MLYTFYDTRSIPPGQSRALHGQPIDPEDMDVWLAQPGFVGGYRDFDGHPLLTTLDELAAADGGGE